MLLGLLFSILTATYTVSSTTAVEPSGNVPTYSNYLYERTATTGQKGQMTAGNSTRLHLTGWDGCLIRSVALQMRSNTESGAGSLIVKMGEKTVWEIVNTSFADTKWAGAYNAEWVTVKKELNVQVDDFEEIDIWISATENSLYIGSYTIEYEPAPMECSRVRFVTGLDEAPADLVPAEIGGAVVLPAWQDTAIWHFMGWSEVEILEDTPVGELLQAGSKYVPMHNTILWAVYSDADGSAVTDYVSGKYVVANRNASTEVTTGSGMAMAGKVIDGAVALCGVEMDSSRIGRYELKTAIADEMIYDVTILSDTTLQIVHSATGTSVGYKNTSLHATNSLWKYKVLSDSSLLVYYGYKGWQYALMLGYDPDNNVVARSQRVDIGKWTRDAFWLFPIVYPEYTSWPFGKLYAIEDIKMPMDKVGECVLHWGGYELRVKDGKKRLYLKR
jgi:hypothetical protein